jgi:LPS-assembly protein
MARPTGTRPIWLRRRAWRGASAIAAVTAIAIGGMVDVRPAAAQKNTIVNFPNRPKPPTREGTGLMAPKPKTATKEQMLLRADELHYDQTNERVAAIGNVQIYYSGSTLEGDKVIYDQKTKRLHAEGNVRLLEPDGKITYGEIIDLSDDFRDGFVDSLRLDMPQQTRFAATRADRQSGDITVFQNGVYTACEPCKDDPLKPPKWQVKATRIIHNQADKMMYFEDAKIEFFGWPIVWLPYFSAPDPTAKRVSGFLMPNFHTSSMYGFAITTPYYWAMAPNYDATFSPMITSKQGPLMQGEWRHRLIDGSYNIRAAGIFQTDRKTFVDAGDTPGDRAFRGSIQSMGQFALTDKWGWGWDGTLISDRSFFQDYGLYRGIQQNNLLRSTPDYVLSQANLSGRGDRSYFDMRAMYFYGFASVDDQKTIPVVHPVIDHDYTVGRPVLGGELSFRSNLTSLSRASASFDAITQAAVDGQFCTVANPDPAVKTVSNCLLRGIPGTYTRASTEASWRRTIVDPWGQVFTPFVSLRADVAAVDITPDPGVSNYIKTGQNDVARFMPTVGVEYRYPFINVQSWGTQTIQPIVQVIARPNETQIGAFPNEDSQSLNLDASNLFRVDKFSGWDRVEGGGRLNAGVQYTAQFNRGGQLSAVFGQSYHLFGQNSFAVGGPTNTGIGSGLDTNVSDYVASTTFQPNPIFAFTSRLRFGESDFTLQRTELQSSANFERWSTTVVYGNYAAQPAIGVLDRREGVITSVRAKIDSSWTMMGAVRYDLKAAQISGGSIGAGYVDDCFIVALNYLSENAYNGTSKFNNTVMFQISLRTLGGNTTTQGLSAANAAIPGLSR